MVIPKGLVVVKGEGGWGAIFSLFQWLKTPASLVPYLSEKS